MSWKLTVTNQYNQDLSALGQKIKPNSTKAFDQTLGNAIVEVPGLGSVNFNDIADKRIDGPSEATWGVLVSYQGEELIYRYEGGGELELTINWLGQAEVESNGSLDIIDLPSFITPQSKINPIGD